MRKKYTAIPLSLILTILLLLTLPMPAYAAPVKAQQEPRCVDSRDSGTGSAAPNLSTISSLEDLVQWHNGLSDVNEWPVLREDIIINRPITLSETPGQKDLGAIEHVIRITAGGKLTLNNSKLSIQGPDTVIIVEPGGQLLLQHGAIYTAPNSHSIVVEKGGKMIQSAAFLLDGGQIFDKNQSNELPVVPDPTPVPEPDPQPPDAVLRPITSIVGNDKYVSCKVGERPEPSAYPSVVLVAYLATEISHEQTELPIYWNLDSVNFDAVGIYTVKGSFTEDVLAAHHLSNPNGISPTLMINVQETGAIKALKGNIISVSRDGLCLIRLTAPSLPSDVEALYVYRSSDGQHWQKCTGLGVLAGFDDFLPYVQTVPPNTYINYRYKTDYQPIWLRVEIVGSSVAGTSNEIKLEMPASAKPGDSTHTGETGDDGGSGGNRGGGGQSEGERELPVSKQPDEGENNLSIGGKQPGEETVLPAPPENSSGVTDSTSENTPNGTYQNRNTSMPDALKDNLGSVPSVSIPSKIGQMEQTVSSPASTQEQNAVSTAGEDVSNSVTEVQELAAEVQSSPPLQKSRGVFLTAGATGFAACGMFLFRKLVQKRKKKP